MDKFKVSLYIRVSTGRQAQEGDSLEEQEKELKKFCEYKNYLIHNTHIERGKSAKDTNRPEYQKLLTDIKDKKINAIVVKKLDRLSRSLLDFEEFMKIAQEKEVEFISLKENFDTTNAMGKAMLRVALVFAQLEREQTSERVIDVMTFRAEQGLYNGGTPPYGYDVINKELVPHKQEKKVIEMIFDRFIEIKSTVAVSKELNSMGIKNRKSLLWDKRRIQEILKRAVYTGQNQWDGVLYKGLHQPIITETKYNQAQDIFNNRSFSNPRNKSHGLLKGLLFCGLCESLMSPNYTKKKNGSIYYYYRCVSTSNNVLGQTKCIGQYVQFKLIHEEVIARVLEHASEEKLLSVQQKVAKYNKDIQVNINLLTANLQNTDNMYDLTKNKKEKYLDSLISGRFSKDERKRINEKIDEYTVEEKKMQASSYKLRFELSSMQDKLKTIEKFKQAIIKIKINYSAMSEEEIHQWLRENISKIIYNNGKIEIIFKELDFGL